MQAPYLSGPPKWIQDCMHNFLPVISYDPDSSNIDYIH